MKKIILVVAIVMGVSTSVSAQTLVDPILLCTISGNCQPKCILPPTDTTCKQSLESLKQIEKNGKYQFDKELLPQILKDCGYIKKTSF